MNLQLGHKRVNSAYNQPFSNTKLNPRNTVINIQQQSEPNKSLSKEIINRGKFPNLASNSVHGKGSILYRNQPLKFETDLLMSQNNADNSKNNLKSDLIKNDLSLNHSLNNRRSNSDFRNLTANINTRGLGNNIFKSNSLGMNSKISIDQVEKVRKLDLYSPGIKAMNKTKSYYNKPKSARDNLNFSNISYTNKSNLNDTNNSFISNDLLNKSRISSNSKTRSSRNKIHRSNTPNLRMGHNKSKEKSDFPTKTNLKIYKQFISKSPNDKISFSIPKKLHSSNKVSQSNLNGLSRGGSSTKNILDDSRIKQFNDLKISKNPQNYPSQIKKVNTKIFNISTKFGSPSIKKIVTGSLISSNTTNLNNVSTNTSLLSKLEQNNTNSLSNNGTNNTIAVILNSNQTNFSLNNRPNSSNNVNNYQIKQDNNFINASKHQELDDGSNQNISRTNMHKDNQLKGTVDFKEITTSPLIRKKIEANKEDLNEDNILNNPIFDKLNSNKTTSIVNNTSQLHNTYNVINNTKIVKSIKKSIKLIHEFSKTGYSGAGVKKVNQDNFFVFKNLVGNPNYIFMAVCDGHGVLGHEVSHYLRENLPFQLNKRLISKNKQLLVHNINPIIEEVFIETNYNLQTSDMIDTTFSGSTCVSLIFTPEKLICANVGDSRAVLGSFVNNEWVSTNLSRDHKPNEKEEASRIKKKGGRIEPFRDEDDSFIGPPRVWLKDDDIPGLAMSRSFGDRVAASVGVIAEPEIIEYNFREEDKFFIIASDGVWDFIESNECVSIIKNFYLNNDILGCCEYLYSESSSRWMREEEVIDDISMIIVFLE